MERCIRLGLMTMETVDIYGLVPSGADLARLLDRLFHFDEVIYHDGAADHRVRSGSEAEALFSALMKDGDFLRFQASTVEFTQGGWLYRLVDGSAVIGLSGDVVAPAGFFGSALEAAMPGCQCCIIGDQPPPMTREEFARLAAAQAERR